MKIFSFTYPQVVPNLYEFLSSVEHKIIYLYELWKTRQLMVATDFHCRKISSCVQQKKKLIQVLNNLRVSKL